MEIDDVHRRAAESLHLAPELIGDLEEMRAVPPEVLVEIPDHVRRRLLRRAQYQDLPSARAAFRLRQERDETGSIPPRALFRALVGLQEIRDAEGSMAVAGMPTGPVADPGALIAATAGIGTGTAAWKSLGPGNIGGRTRALIPHPQRPDTLWAGSAGGGVWRTDNGGQTWRPVDDMMANLAVSCMAIDPRNPDVLYAGTGEGFGGLESIRGAGIFVTRNGRHWAQLASTTGPDFRAVNRIAISADGATLLVATPVGVFRSTDDSASWTRVHPMPTGDIRFHPTDPHRAVAGGQTNGEAYWSDDSGATWTAAMHPQAWQSRVELTFAHADPSIVYAGINVEGGQVWRSVDGGKTFAKRAMHRPNGRAARYLGDQGWYDNAIWAGDPHDSNFLIVGGIDLWRSRDGGDSVIDISTWYDNRSAHADHHCIVAAAGFNGTSNRRVYFGNDGGIYYADDVYTVGDDHTLPRIHGWAELVNTYEVTQFYGAAVNPTTGIIIGGTQDNGTIRFDPANGPEHWTTMFGGDGGWSASDPADPNYFYGEYIYLNLHRSGDGGMTSEHISGQYWDAVVGRWDWKPFPYSIPDAQYREALFIAPFILDPNNTNTILAGGRSLWRTRDAKAPVTDATGPSWERIKTSVGSRISALAIAHGDADLVWVGHDDGQLFQTTDATAANPTWKRIDAAIPHQLPQRYITQITVDVQNHQSIFVTFGGYSAGNIWESADGGTTWTDRSGYLPQCPIRAVTIHPQDTRRVYLGTEVGVFASEDGGKTWSPTNEGPTNCSVDDLCWMGTTLICVTHGRGIFSIDLPITPPPAPRPGRRRPVRS